MTDSLRFRVEAVDGDDEFQALKADIEQNGVEVPASVANK